MKRRREQLAASDPAMAELIAELGEWDVKRRQRRRGAENADAYATLLRAIVGQQLSTKAAATIHGRVLELFGGRDPTPQELLDADTDALRACGLSGRKVEYIQDLAAHVLDGELELDRLDQLSDEEVIEEIVAVRGLGRWTAEMFLIFHLERPDVFSGGDLGLRRAVQLCHDLEEMPKPAEAAEIARRWSPNRSLASIYLWESLANKPVS